MCIRDRVSTQSTWGRFSHIALKKYTQFFPSLLVEERRDLKDYLYQMLLNKGTGEKALPYVLSPGGYGVDPLLPYLPSLKMPTTIFFGGRDWMYQAPETEPSLDTISPYIKLTIIKDASHQACLDVPETIASEILKDMEQSKNLTF
eukprot:TRINITY_DN4109_c0_g1_i1.p2 TRINITY_DN4109_c0_g1~~TRINITY_DN4109_c0_g1_i1.p2  ORF type:complete len:146 (+),score=30.32 TRINITY_DN4109_c0_g1_i1:124-561(+)